MEGKTNQRAKHLLMLDVVESLGDETKDLALNLALYLAKAKGSSEQLSRMEPEFIRLVNGTVKVVQELATILKAAKDQEKMIFEVPTGRIAKDQMETKLEEIVRQCNQILASWAQSQDLMA